MPVSSGFVVPSAFRLPPSALMYRSVQSRIVSVVSPRKSNLTRPTASTSFMSNCDTTLPEPSAA